jgi:hypothetical protein
MVNGRHAIKIRRATPIRSGLRKVQTGRPIIKAGLAVGKRRARARARGQPVPPDQLGFFSGKALPITRKGRKVGSDFDVVGRGMSGF